MACDERLEDPGAGSAILSEGHASSNSCFGGSENHCIFRPSIRMAQQSKPSLAVTKLGPEQSDTEWSPG
jgi:hypothetical protein